jgi:hypothetical protein
MIKIVADHTKEGPSVYEVVLPKDQHVPDMSSDLLEDEVTLLNALHKLISDRCRKWKKVDA